MTVQYELVDLPIVSLSEISKAVLTAADAGWKYTAVSFEEWPAIKPSTPFGHLPILREYDPATGEKVFEVAESSVIETYLATKLGLNGKTLQETTLIASVRSVYDEIQEQASRFSDAPNEEAQAKEFEKLKEAIGSAAVFLDKFIANNPTGSGYFVGDSLSVADITAYVSYVWTQCTSGYYLVIADKVPRLLQLVEKVKKHPKLEAFLADFEQRVQARLKVEFEKAAAAKAAKAAKDAAATN